MSKIEDMFQKRVEQLQSGRPLEECSEGLPEQEAQLLALVAELKELDYPEPEPTKVAVQRAQVVKHARAELGKRREPQQQGARTTKRRWPGLAAPAFAVAVPVVLVIALAWLAAAGAGIWWLRSRSAETPTALVAAHTVEEWTYDPQSASLGEVRGLVQVQAANAAWVSVDQERGLQAGDRVRTGALSSASLTFADGSVARLGPDSELSVDELDVGAPGGRVIVLSQRSGESWHDVVPTAAKRAQYAVHTASGSGVAKGTRFLVRITPDQGARFSVDEGAVLVSNQETTVEVAAGQAAVVGANEPPSEPFFRITGEGEVQEIGATGWTIAGQAFETHESTSIVGSPLVGDWVRVEGHLLPDGTHVADLIVLAHESPADRFEIQGEVQAIGATEWTIAGQVVGVDENTQIEAGIIEGSMVHAEGVLLAGGELLAEQIELLQEDEPGLPFEIVGIVQAMGGTAWTVSGRSIAVNADTQIQADLAVGDLVEVEGWILPDGAWLARAIERQEEDERGFEFTGTVESMAPWIVSGIVLTTDEWTEIDPEIADGDTVQVRGRILNDGTWLASEIRLLDEEPSYVEYVGQVESIDPWVVGGKAFAVNEQTEIEDEIAVDDWVRVRALILPDGSWLAVEIERVDDLPDGGCVSFSARVVEVSAEQIVLDNGMTIELHPGLEIVGDVQPGSVVMVEACTSEDGTVTVVRIVVYEDEIPLVTPTPEARTVTLCHKPGTPAEKTKLLPESAVQGHLGHGDYLGACEGDENATPVTPDPDASSTPDADSTPGAVVTICHKPGTPAEKTLLLPESAVQGHLGHGDALGSCEGDEDVTPDAPTPDASLTPVAPMPDDLETPEAKVAVCHKPGTRAEKTLHISQIDLNDHLEHGDYAGVCGEGGDGTPVAPTPGADSTREVKVEICHKPGTPAQKSLFISQIDVNDHIEHGDYVGACSESEDSGQNNGRGKDKKPKKPKKNK